MIIKIQLGVLKVLQICHKIPFPLHDGGALSLYNNALGLLLQNVEVKVLALDTPKSPIDFNSIPSDFRKKVNFEFAKVDTRFNPIKAFINLFSHRSYLSERFYSKTFDNHLAELLDQQEFDFIQLEHLYMCLYLKTIRKHSKAKVILRPQNVESKVWEQITQNEKNPLKRNYLKLATKRLKVFEIDAANNVDGIIAISSKDENIFLDFALQIMQTHIPMGFDLSNLKVGKAKEVSNKNVVFYHLGSMDWLPNVQGLKWFIKEVMPYLIKLHPEFIFRIAGKNMPEWFFNQQNKNMIVDGQVKDAIEYQLDKNIMIVPLLAGSGIRIKIIEGMALGKTILSTSIGAEGIPYTSNENILIADTKEEFASQIARCLKFENLSKEIGKNAKEFAARHYDLNHTGSKMIDFYNCLS